MFRADVKDGSGSRGFMAGILGQVAMHAKADADGIDAVAK